MKIVDLQSSYGSTDFAEGWKLSSKWNNEWKTHFWITLRTTYSGIDRVKFVEDSLLKHLPKSDHTPSNFLKAAFHKFYLDRS